MDRATLIPQAPADIPAGAPVQSPWHMPDVARRRLIVALPVTGFALIAGMFAVGLNRDPKILPSIFASSHGDLAVCDSMSTTLAASPELVSPIKFHNSVHNAAVGYWTIATGAVEASTALSASNETFAEALLEAAVYALSEHRPVLFVAYDIQAVGGLASVTRSDGLFGVALVIAPDKNQHSKCALTIELVDLPTSAVTEAPTSPAAAAVSGNALAPMLPALERIALGDVRPLVLPLARHRGLSVTVLETRS